MNTFQVMYTSPAALIKYQQYKKMPGIQWVKSMPAAQPPVTCTYKAAWHGRGIITAGPDGFIADLGLDSIGWD